MLKSDLVLLMAALAVFDDDPVLIVQSHDGTMIAVYLDPPQVLVLDPAGELELIAAVTQPCSRQPVH